MERDETPKSMRGVGLLQAQGEPCRRRHQWRLFRDVHAWKTLLLAVIACLASGGLVYLGYFLHVLGIARRATCLAPDDAAVLVFGKHAPGGTLDPDFRSRLLRAHALWIQRPDRLLLLLGGAMGSRQTEAEIAWRGLLALGVDADAGFLLEGQSRDTLQNLRNARVMLRDAGYDGMLALVSNRYHLARCALFAGWLGMPHRPCAAEDSFHWSAGTLWRIAREAGYVCWLDIGMRWAQLTRDRSLLARVS